MSEMVNRLVKRSHLRRETDNIAPNVKLLALEKPMSLDAKNRGPISVYPTDMILVLKRTGCNDFAGYTQASSLDYRGSDVRGSPSASDRSKRLRGRGRWSFVLVATEPPSGMLVAPFATPSNGRLGDLQNGNE